MAVAAVLALLYASPLLALAGRRRLGAAAAVAAAVAGPLLPPVAAEWLPGLALGAGGDPSRALVGLVSVAAAVLAVEHVEAGPGLYASGLLLAASVETLALSSTPAALAAAWEAVLLSSTLVLALGSRRAAARYMVYMQLGSLPALAGLAAGGPAAGAAAAALILLGAAVKAGAYPLHLGLVEAYTASSLDSAVVLAASAPAPALLVAGAWGRYPGAAAALLAASSAVLAARVLLENDSRRVAAYAAAGHGALALAAAPLGARGALLLLAAGQAVAEPLVFAVLWVVEEAAGTLSLRRLGLLLHSMPVTGLAAYAAYMSLAGAPPFALFPGELLLLAASLRAGAPAAALMLAAVLGSTVYALRLWRCGFMHPVEARPRQPPGEPPARRLAALLGLAALSAVVGSLPLLLGLPQL